MGSRVPTFQNHPRRGYHILYLISDISYLLTCAFGGGPNVEKSGQGGGEKRLDTVERTGVDWGAIRTEYITGTVSLRWLAGKYGVCPGTVSRRAKREDWAGQRRSFVSGTQQRILEAEGSRQTERAARLQETADTLLTRVSALLESPEASTLPPQSLRHISGVLKDIRDVQMLKSPLDYQEQKLKIANLRAQAEQDRGSVTVTLEGTVKDYAR